MTRSAEVEPQAALGLGVRRSLRRLDENLNGVVTVLTGAPLQVPHLGPCADSEP
jgi:hypothetical protein